MYNAMSQSFFPNGNMPYPHPNAPMARPTKANIELFIANSIQINPDFVKFVEISDRPSVWKHACVKAGVSILNVTKLNFFDVAFVYYTICPLCSRVVYYVEK